MQEQAKHWRKYYIPRNFLTGETERFNLGGASPLFGWAEYESEQILYLINFLNKVFKMI